MRTKLIALATVLSLVLGAAPALADTTTDISTYLTDTEYVLDGQTMIVKAGSAYNWISVNETELVAQIPDHEAFEVRTPGLYPSSIENDGGVAVCNVITTRENRVFVYGPRTVTFHPREDRCTVVASAYSTNTAPEIGLSAPVAGDILVPGTATTVFWSTLSGRNPNAVRLRLSTDGGRSFDTVLADNLVNNGFYVWNIPSDLSASEVRLKLDGYDSGYIVALAVSGQFSVGEAAAESAEAAESEGALVSDDSTGSQTLTYLGYEPIVATFAAATISIDHGLTAAEGRTSCIPNTRLKSFSDSAVYYCGVDGKRYVFPNLATHRTWYDDFAGVIEVSDDQLARVQLGGNVTYRPGIRLIKIQTDPKVYAVDAGGTLRWIETEAVAAALYGSNWNQKVDDVSDAFFVNYTVGESIAAVTAS